MPSNVNLCSICVIKEIAWSISKEIRKYHIVCLFVPKYTLTCNVSKYDGKSLIRSILDDV